MPIITASAQQINSAVNMDSATLLLIKQNLEDGRDACRAGVTKKHQKFIFEYWVFSQKSYLNMWCFEKVHICIPKIPYLHT